jgi:hypothetical protein
MNRKHMRRGMILILVLVVIAMLSLGAYSFTDLMLAQHEAQLLTGQQMQTRVLVDSGVEAVRMLLAAPDVTRAEAGGIFDNSERLRGVTIIEDEDPKGRGCFSVICPNLDSSGYLDGVRHGLEDESTRLNLNTLITLDKGLPGTGRQLLMALPEMTEDVADAILDWLDEDDEPREYGTEIEYYSGLQPPYGTKNGPLATVEELLLVKGVTPQLLFGTDINRNGQLDSHETADAGSGGSTDPASYRGWSAYLTLYSLEWNISPDRLPRIYLNTNDLNKLKEELEAVFSPEWVTFIIAYRQMGPYTRSSIADTTEAQVGATGELNMDLQPQFPLAQLLDLIDAEVQYTFPDSTTPILLASPFTTATLGIWLPELMDRVTINSAKTIPGRININQASATILSGIPGITPEIVEKIISQRSPDVSGDYAAHRFETWLLTEGVVTIPEMRQLMPFITGGGDVYRAQVIGYFQGGQASSRAEVVFDATSPLPRVLLWRDISHLGRGYAVETLGVDFSE